MSRRRPRRLPVEYLLALACLIAAVVLGASEFANSFTLTQGGEPIQQLGAGDRHSYAMLILAIFAVASLGVALATGSKPAAMGVAIAGAVALILFLAIDLPKANQIGSLSSQGEFLAAAKAEPAAGFWLSLLGSVALTAAGAAIATLEPEQLQIFGRGERRAGPSPAPAENPEPPLPGDAPRSRTAPRERTSVSGRRHGRRGDQR